MPNAYTENQLVEQTAIAFFRGALLEDDPG